jgi:hypothetical protein
MDRINKAASNKKFYLKMEGEVVSGKKFNKLYKDKVFVKLTNESENHNGLQFKTGLNEDAVPFNPSGHCNPGGIYFCQEDRMIEWLSYSGMKMQYCRQVQIPTDSRVYIECDKFKADRVILTERKLISEQKFIEAIEKGNILLACIAYQTEMICKAAIRNNCYELKAVIDQTDEICLEAVKRDGLVLEYVENQTEEICMAAVRQCGHALKYVRDQTRDICTAAVCQYGHALKYVRDQTREICMAAVRQNGRALKYVNNQTEEICMAAVQQDGVALYYVKNQTKEICKRAVNKDGNASKYVKVW